MMLIGLEIVLLVAAGAWVWRTYFQSYHYAAVEEGVLYRDGLRSLREFATACRSSHPRTVISLVNEDELAREPFSGEREYCIRNGIRWVNIPIVKGSWPTSEQVQAFLAEVTEKKNQPVLVHCAEGVRRTGMMVAAYQQSVLKYDDPTAKAALLRFGHSQRSIGDIERFIDIYDAQSRAVTTALPQSQE